MLTYVFPGQGSQAIGMGSALFKEYANLTAQADEIVGYSIAELCLADPQGQLNQTQYTQPALYVVNALSYFKKINASEKLPDFVAGHSLGEFNALLAAGVFDFETGLKLVKKRGELMAQAKEGGMAAIIGLTVDKINAVLQQNNLAQLTIANYNTHTQLVISGTKAAIENAQPFFEQAGAMMYIPLKVSGAFHSPFMQEAQQEFGKFLSQFNFSEPHIPVISNMTGNPYSLIGVKPLLSQQIVNPVRWTETITNLIAQGVTSFEEVGPGNVLAGLIKRIRNGL